MISAKAPSMSFAILTDSSDSSESAKGGGSSKGGGGGRLFGQPAGESQRGPRFGEANMSQSKEGQHMCFFLI